MFKNQATKFLVYAYDATTNLPKTGDAANITVYVSKDFGAVTATADTTATELDATNAKGYYWVDAAQAETNADDLLISGKSSTANIVVIGAPAHITTIPVSPFKKNTARVNFPFEMVNSTSNSPEPSATVTARLRIDGGAWGAGTLSNLTNRGGGAYTIDFAAADRNGDNISLEVSAPGCYTNVYVQTMIP